LEKIKIYIEIEIITIIVMILLPLSGILHNQIKRIGLLENVKHIVFVVVVVQSNISAGFYEK